ncbi:stomatin-like protein 1 [Elysia marginata]|uniref:Stomatin-like protein 1 n=1 Tax=Elysia marginata TaxID=1093978 RepID=A0AAV4EHE6_9GAST|nr:stomatin-like protein 1 [Elysia marginata]
MAAKYNRLSTDGDCEDRMTFDFSSAFTYADNDFKRQKYGSAFTYGNKDDLCSSKKEVEKASSDRFTWILVYLGYMVIYMMTFPIIIWFSLKRVKEGERMVVFRLGHLRKAQGPGLALVFPFIDRYFKKDVSLRAFSVPPKQVITGDKAIIEVGAEIYFQIVDVEKSVTNVQDLDRSTRILVQTALCNLLAQMNLADIESERRAVADNIMEKSNSTCSSWGVHITRAELSQVKVLSQPLPKQAPSVMMPPGLFDTFGDSGSNSEKSSSSLGLQSVFAQLASSLTNQQGAGQTEAITQALHAMVAPHLSGTEASAPQVLEGQNVTSALLQTVSTPGNAASSFSSSNDKVEILSQSARPVRHAAEMNPEQILAMIRKALCEEVVAKVQETFQVEISGSGAGTYFLDLCNGEGTIIEGPNPSADPSATLHLTFEDLQAMLCGVLKPYQAYMSGRLRVTGDTAAALKLDQLASRIQTQLALSTSGHS